MITVTGTFRNPDDTPATGRVILETVWPWPNERDPRIVVQGPVAAVLDEHGSFSVDVVASDDPDWRSDRLVPYRVVTQVPGMGRTRTGLFTFHGPGPVDLSTLTPIDECDLPLVSWVPVPGPQGPQGPQGPPGPPGQQGPAASLTLDALLDVSAPANTPAGRVLGTTATGQWGPIDADARYVNTAGDTMTGPLVVPAPAAVNVVPRLARTPNPDTGDLGLPGYAGSDTGWRGIPSLYTPPAGVTIGMALIRRSGTTVELYVRLTAAAAMTGAATILPIANVPTGFKPRALGAIEVALPSYVGSSDMSTPTAMYAFAPNVGLRARHYTTALNGTTIMWLTDDGWPASLPGTQITAPAAWT